jgi:hypothetical protein
MLAAVLEQRDADLVDRDPLGPPDHLAATLNPFDLEFRLSPA